jgi:tetratricopeptide (TPR) repeat protein
MSNLYDISAFVSYFNKYFDSANPEGFPTHSNETPEVLLLAAKKEFPKHPWPYLQLGTRAMKRGDYSEALSVYTEMLNNLPINFDGFLGSIEALIALEKFEDTELLYRKRFKNFPQQKLKTDDAFRLLERIIKTKAFPPFSSANFTQLSFLKHIIQDNVNFLYRISNIFMENLFHEYIEIANQYVIEHGGRFVYMSIDNVYQTSTTLAGR